jgi:hypothetical protein
MFKKGTYLLKIAAFYSNSVKFSGFLPERRSKIGHSPERFAD